MTKNKTVPTFSPSPEQRSHKKGHENEPVSGSKKVKNRNHSRQNHGEGR